MRGSNQLLLFIMLCMLILFSGSCKKDEIQVEDQEEVIPDYRDELLGAFNVDYTRVTFPVTDPSNQDTLTESFTGNIAASQDSFIILSGASNGDLRYKVAPSGELIYCGGVDAGMISATSITCNYGYSGMNCPTEPLGLIVSINLSGTR